MSNGELYIHKCNCGTSEDVSQLINETVENYIMTKRELFDGICNNLLESGKMSTRDMYYAGMTVAAKKIFYDIIHKRLEIVASSVT